MKKVRKERNIEKYIVAKNVRSDEGYEKCIEDYIDYYDRRGKKYKHRYYFWTIVKLIAITIVPVLEITVANNNGANWAVLLASVIAIFSDSFLEKIKAFEKYLSYRNMCDKLCSEQRMYKTRCGYYQDIQNPLQQYVKRVEMLIGTEGEIWIKYMKKQEKQEK